MKKYSPQTLSATLLVAGTCIGGGMLALPVATAPTGFFPSTCMMLIAWIAMACTALYLIEVGFWMKKEDAHVISMSRAMLKTPGKNTSWVLFLFISYSSLIAYTAGGGHLLVHALNTLGSCTISKTWGCVLFTLLFGPALYFKHTTLGTINSWFFAAMVVAYALLIGTSTPFVRSELLERSNWSYALVTLPILLTAFSFQTMVPSLHSYLQHDRRSLQFSVIVGTALAFLVYLTWQVVALGTIPLDGPSGLLEAFREGQPATHFLGIQTGNPWVETFASAFAFFALVTSYLGIGLGLYDFLSDGCNIPKRGKGSFALVALIIVPVIIGATALERIFLLALEASGGFGDTILNGMMPVLMVWVGRYVKRLKKAGRTVPGGKGVLIAVFSVYLITFLIELGLHTGLIHTNYNPEQLNLTVESAVAKES